MRVDLAIDFDDVHLSGILAHLERRCSNREGEKHQSYPHYYLMLRVCLVPLSSHAEDLFKEKT